MIKIIQDEDSTSLQERYAVIHATRQSRKRYAESTVTLFETAEQAYAAADKQNKRYAAVVYGPSVSSESQRIYYLVRWL